VVAVGSPPVDQDAVRRCFDGYLEAFAACGRGEREVDSLLEHYGVPLLLTTDDGFVALASADEVVAAVQPQITGMRAAGYARTEVLDAEITVLNATAALYRGAFAYRGRDGGELRRLTATYLVTDGAPGPRISVLAVHA
jgi:NTF2-like protein (DUF6841)